MGSTTAGSVAPPLRIGPHLIDPPVVLAPMAEITTSAFRVLCREQGESVGLVDSVAGAHRGLYVCEMITARALVERNAETLRMIRFAPQERPRSMQLYAVRPDVLAAAVRMVVEENLADHIDLNFGCPVPKVTRRGGGAALPWKSELFRQVLRAAAGAAAGRVPVTLKMRMGIDAQSLTYLEAGRTAVEEGISAIALHARTAAQAYSGTADWSAIRRLKEHVSEIPVLGNGDIWSAADAVRMVRETGCDGVVVGRGCLGRPQLFAGLVAAFAGRPDDSLEHPHLRDVVQTMRRHAHLLAEEMGEQKGLRDFRKHVAWYLKGFSVGSATRHSLSMVTCRAELDGLLSQIDLEQDFPRVAMAAPRGRTGAPRAVALPEGWLATRTGMPSLGADSFAGSGG